MTLQGLSREILLRARCPVDDIVKLRRTICPTDLMQIRQMRVDAFQHSVEV